MLAIPAIDIYHGKVARLNKGDFSTAKYYDLSPLEYAKQFDAIKSKWLHIVDLVASVDGKITAGSQITEIKKATRMKIEFGGGIKTYEQAELALSFGVDRIVLGSMTVSSKNIFERIVESYGPEKIVVATDSKDEMILIKGWTELSAFSLWEHLDYCTKLGVKYFLCTDIAKDGMLEGPNIDLYTRVMKKHPNIKLIASGGVSSVTDLIKLDKKNIYASVVGKAIYENKISMEELKQFVS
jgi:phosphoribosylformimino-5-aminoimidazole carboxamide ribotide isomerase